MQIHKSENKEDYLKIFPYICSSILDKKNKMLLYLCLTKIFCLMTDEEYKKIALEIFDELDELDEFDEDDQDVELTNVGEIFYTLLIESFKKIQEEIPLCDYSGLVSSSNDEEYDKSDKDAQGGNILRPDVKDETLFMFIDFAFKTVKTAIENINDSEYVLYNIGIKDVKGLIAKMNTVLGMPKSVKRIRDEFEILDELIINSVNHSLFISLILVSFMRKSQNSLIKELKKEDSLYEELILLNKRIKRCFGKYKFLCEDRILHYRILLKKINNDFNRIKEFVDEYDLDKIYEQLLSCNSLNEFEDKFDEMEFSNSQKVIIIDCILLLYYAIYLNPKNLINMVFDFTTDVFPIQINEAVFNALRSSPYAPLIQYEYEWWCKETGQTLNIPFPFSSEPFDKNNTTIVDYDLNNEKYNTGFINQPRPIAYKEPNTQVAGENTELIQNCIVTRKQIIHDLNPYFKIFMNRSSQTRGSFFIAHYLDDIITFSETIKDSYNAYGFAYILFNSKYFNWDNANFNDNFVNNIISIFGIKIEEDKTYPESKAKDSAKKILNKIELQGILNEDVLKSFDL